MQNPNNNTTEIKALNDQEFLALKPEEQIIYLKSRYPTADMNWDYEHNILICERSKTPVEPLISQEFFVDYYSEFEYQPKMSQKSKDNKLKEDWLNLRLETERFELRIVEEEDAENIFREFDESITAHTISGVNKSTEEAKTWIQKTRSKLSEKKQISFCILAKGEQKKQAKKEATVKQKVFEKGEFLGIIGVFFPEDFDYTEFLDGKVIAEIAFGTWVKKSAQNTGVDFESLSRIMDFVAIEFRPTKMVWEAYENNLVSQKLAQKLGFESDETLQKNRNESEIDQNKKILGFSKPGNRTTLQKIAIHGIKNTNFNPIEHQKRAIEYFENIKNWCISRDLIWGHKMPLWYNSRYNPSKIFYSYQDWLNNKIVGGKKDRSEAKYLIFDFDGVFGDTSNTYYEASLRSPKVKAFRNSLGYGDTPEEVQAYRKYARGIPLVKKFFNGQNIAEMLEEELGSAEMKFFDNFIQKVVCYKTLFPNTKMGIVSSGADGFLRRGIAGHPLLPMLFDDSSILTSAQGVHKKDKIQILCQKWSIDSSQIHFFTDTRSDVYELLGDGLKIDPKEAFLSPEQIYGNSWGFDGREVLLEVLGEGYIMDQAGDFDKIFDDNVRVRDMFHCQIEMPKYSEIYDENGVETKSLWLQEDKILDTWFSSTLWPMSTLGWAKA